MARLLACSHCGAPHRVVAGQTSFTCDYCRTLVSFSQQVTQEELVAARPVEERQALSALNRWLQMQDLPGIPFRFGQPVNIPFWQVLSTEGEEYLFQAGTGKSPLPASFSLPAMELVARGHESARHLEPLDAPRMNAEEAVAAAQASFSGSESTVETIRLIWIPVMEIVLETRKGPLKGCYIAAAEKVIFPRRPDSELPRVDGRRIGVLAVYVIAALLLGMSLKSSEGRAVAEGMLFAGGVLGWLAWRSGLPLRRWR